MSTPENSVEQATLIAEGGRLGPISLETMWHGRPATQRERVQVMLSDAGDALRLTLDASFHGDPAPAAPVGSTPKLWEHEVVELFIRGADGSYLELEIGPLGHHLALFLSGPRQVVWEGRPLRVRTAVARGLWSADAWIPRDWLPPGPHALNVCAVHGARRPAGPRGDGRRYLSLVTLPGLAPDFHQPALFVPAVLP